MDANKEQARKLSDERKEAGELENEETKGEGRESRGSRVIPPPALTQPDFLSPNPTPRGDHLHTPVDVLQQGANTQILTSPTVLPRSLPCLDMSPTPDPVMMGAARPSRHLNHPCVSDDHP